MMVPAGIVFTFGLTLGLFLGFLLDLFFGPTAPLSLALPIGLYTVYRVGVLTRRHP